MIAKIPLRIARTILPMNNYNLRLIIPQSVIEKNHLYQLIENDILIETTTLICQSQNSEQTDIKGFKVQEFAEELRLELSRTVGNVQILICIDCNFFESNFEQEISQIVVLQNETSTENIKPNFQNYHLIQVPFSIYLTKGNGLISCYECSAFQNDIQINMVSIIDDIAEHKMTPRQDRGINEYEGSNNGLQETIQQEILKYLQTFGIDGELAGFIQNLQNDREKTIYMNWLQNKLSYH